MILRGGGEEASPKKSPKKDAAQDEGSSNKSPAKKAAQDEGSPRKSPQKTKSPKMTPGKEKTGTPGSSQSSGKPQARVT